MPRRAAKKRKAGKRFKSGRSAVKARPYRSGYPIPSRDNVSFQWNPKPYGLSLLNSKSPFPMIMHTKHEYCQNFGLGNGGAGTFGNTQTMRLNSLFDPDLTGVGHQPYGYDQMAALYNVYKVTRVQVELTFTAMTVNTGYGCACGLMIQTPYDTSLALAANLPATVDERPNSQVIYLPGTGLQREVYQDWELHTLCGMTRAAFDADPTVSALVGVTPAVVPLLLIAIADQSGALGVGGVVVTCATRFTYHVKWTDRVTVAQS